MSRATLAVRRTEEVPAPSAWPLRGSPDGRSVVSDDGEPFFVFGDSTQSLLHSLSETASEAFFANRESWGINANWTHLYSNWGGDGGWGNPFNSGNGTGSDISQPREAYFQHVDRVLDQAKAHGICLFLGVPGINGTMTAGGSADQFFGNGTTKANNFGRYLGNRYANQGNIVWVCGNDYSNWNTPNDSIMRAFMDGLLATAPALPLTAQIYGTPSLTWNATNYRTRVDMNLSYVYAPPYTNTKKGYQQNAGVPLIQHEVLYDQASMNNNNNRHGYWGTAANLRRVMWWSVLWGCNGGYFYGNEDLWTITNSEVTPSVLNTTPLQHTSLAAAFFRSHPWYALVPDFNHEIVTAGYGAFTVGAENFDLGTATATTTGATPDGSLVIAYMERGRNTTVAMNRLSGPALARWFNPRTAAYTTIGTFDNTGSHVFVPPTTADDWALVLEA